MPLSSGANLFDVIKLKKKQRRGMKMQTSMEGMRLVRPKICRCRKRMQYYGWEIVAKNVNWDDDPLDSDFRHNLRHADRCFSILSSLPQHHIQ